VIDKNKVSPFTTNINNIAVERDFYRVNALKDPIFWEDFYAREMEPKISDVFKRLISLCTLSKPNVHILDKKIKTELSFIISSLLLRTKLAREQYFEIGEETSNNVLADIMNNFQDLLNEENRIYLRDFDYSTELHKELFLKIINDETRLERFSQILCQHYWICYKNINYKTEPIMTSDHPVLFKNVATGEHGLKNNGLGRLETAIFFPINSEIILGIYPPYKILNKLKNYDGRLVIIDESTFFQKLNELQIKQSYRQAYVRSE